jgi:hypothetical protein
MEVVSTESSWDSNNPDIEVDSNGDVHILSAEFYWEDPQIWDVSYKMKPSGGSWTSAEVLSLWGMGFFLHNLIVESDGTCHVAWNEMNIETDWMFDVFYRAKPCGGSWTGAELVSTEGDEWTDSVNPNIAVDSLGIVHVVWSDDFDYDGSGEDFDVFYKRRIDDNEAPDEPVIDGPSNGKPGISYTYTFISAFDPDGDEVAYYIDWDDGSTSGWTSFMSSGIPGYSESHTWALQGKYIIKAKAKDTYGAESDWAEFEVSMPRCKSFSNLLFLRFLNRFPLLNILLQRLKVL